MGSKCKYEGNDHQPAPYTPDAESCIVSNKREVNLAEQSTPTSHSATTHIAITIDNTVPKEHMNYPISLKLYDSLQASTTATPNNGPVPTLILGLNCHCRNVDKTFVNTLCVLHADTITFGKPLKYEPTSMAAHHSPDELAARKKIADMLVTTDVPQPAGQAQNTKCVATVVSAGSFDLQLVNPDVDLLAMVTHTHQHALLTGVASSNSYGNTLISNVQLRFINRKALKERDLRGVLEPLLGGSLTMSVIPHSEHIAKAKWDTWKVTVRSSDPTTSAPLLRFLCHLYDPDSPLHQLPIIHQPKPDAPVDLVHEGTPLVRVISSEHHSATTASHHLQARVFLRWDKYAGAQLSSRVYRFLRMAVRTLAGCTGAPHETHSDPTLRALEVEHVFQQDTHRRNPTVSCSCCTQPPPYRLCVMHTVFASHFPLSGPSPSSSTRHECQV